MEVEVSDKPESNNDFFHNKAAWWCIFGGVTLFIYLLKRFFRGREQVKRNCDLISRQLEHLQRIIEENERKEKESEAKEGKPEENLDKKVPDIDVKDLIGSADSVEDKKDK